MRYELHLTTEPNVDLDAWGTKCRWINAKPIVLELSKGDFPKQVMSASMVSDEDFELQDDILRWMERVKKHFWCHEILRTKLESELCSPIHAKYFEAHFKSKSYIKPLPGTEIARNVLNGNWLLTRRVRDVSVNEAEKMFRSDFDVLSKNHDDLRVEMESCLMDDNESLDEGWMN